MLAGGFFDGPGQKAGITLWEVASGRVLRSMDGPFAGAMALAFSPDGKVLISCVSWSGGKTPERVVDAGRPRKPEESAIDLREVATGKEIRRTGMGKTRIHRAVLAPDGTTLASVTADKSSSPRSRPTARPW